MPLDLLATLRDLVATPSVNPMGRPVSGPEYFEYRLTEYLEGLFARLKISTWRQQIAEKRDNLIARIDGDPPLERGGTLLLLEAHQDTVPVDGMTIPPFEAQVREGRLYGRGACDNKGGMSAMLAAMARLADTRTTGRPTVIMACTVNEEHGFTGATGLCRLWAEKTNAILPRQPDAAIVAEPTNLNVVVAHKGMVRWRCHTRGRAAHSSQPDSGENAIYRMARVVTALERFQREVIGKSADGKTMVEHPLCGRPTLSVGTISGGISVNTVPDRCTIEIDRRLLPGEDPQQSRQQIVDFLAADTSLGQQIEHETPFMQSRGLRDDHNQTVASRMLASAKEVTGGASRSIGVAFGTDAFCYDGAGVPTVVFGPGSINQAHTADEWVPLAEVEQAAESIYQVVTQWK